MKFCPDLKRTIGRLLTGACVLLACAVPAHATWSIVIVDRATGEVCVASATCISGFSIDRAVPVLVVGVGAGAAQSAIDQTGINRILMRDGLLAGDDPALILANLAASDAQHQSRQYGIVSLDGGVPVSFTGTGAGFARISLTGEVGTLRYAMQGNVLAGQAVLIQAEQTLLSTEGDLVTRVMAAMETARSMGGDGRCSCVMWQPASCGSPPPSFTHSAYTAQIALARVGDLDGSCNQNGCANGPYFLRERVAGNASFADPVVRLQRRVDHWRRQRAGQPDHLLSEVTSTASRLPADGVTTATVTIRLADIDGLPILTQANLFTITDLVAGGSPVTVGSPVWQGGDTYSVPISAASSPGEARFAIEVWHDWQSTRLYPDLVISVDPADGLHVGLAEVSSSGGAVVPFTLNTSAASAGLPYLLLVSGSGTQPGTPFGNLTLPLNGDRLLDWSLAAPHSANWPGNQGQLDASGHASAVLTIGPDQLTHYVGSRLDFCALFGTQVTAPVGFDVLP